LTVPLQKFGRYEIEQELGRGGMAVVYLARDPYVKRQVAVKVLPHQFTSDPQFRARFQREAEVIAALEHPHIVPIYDYGEQDEQLFLVMRYMPGGSLADCLRRGPLSTAEIARIVAPLASALDKAHARGIIHRDLKPGNILFDGEGEPYISDFGIAKLTQASTLLSGSALVGTPVYMSPEQWRGEKVDGRSDIYALGGMLYEMLSGRLPYEASTPAEVMFKCLMEPPPRLLETQPELDPALETVVAQAMAKNRDERFATAGELATALETAIRLTPPVATPVPPPLPINANAVVPAPPELEELPPLTPPTVAATPPPTMPVPVAPQAVEAIAEPTPEAPPTVAARIEAAEAAPPEAPTVEVEGLPTEAGESIQAEPAIEVAETAPLEAPEAEAIPIETPEPAAEIAPVIPTPTVAPPAQPALRRAPRPLARFALPAASVAVIVLLIVGGAIFGPGFFSTSAATPTEMSAAIVESSPSPTRTISSSPTLTQTPTVTPTRTSRPTITPTSPPAWVSDFAEPILAAIADQKPDFQDDFSSRAGEWAMVWSWCADGKYVEGEMVVSESVESGCTFTREMWYTDFVAEMDVRFVADSQQDGGQPVWQFYFRCEDFTCNNGSRYGLRFYFDGDAEVDFREMESSGNWAQTMPQTSRSGLNTNHVLVIAKGQTIAFFVNGQPVFHSQDKPRWLNGGMGWSADGTVAFDNFKIWDISDLPLPPTSTPRPTATSTSAAASQSPTPTQRPTQSAASQPAWVGDFAEPILAAIADQNPDFQDDFGTRAGGWKLEEWCAIRGRMEIENGEMTVSECRVWREMWYPDFVAEIDARFLPGAPPGSYWEFLYRHRNIIPSNSHGYKFGINGDVEAGFAETEGGTHLQGVALPGTDVNHVLVIAKGQAFALYINDQPVFYKLGEPVWPNGGIRMSVEDTVAFDNFKIWDISDLPLTATPTGTVTGRTVWNGQPIAGVTVKLCTKWVFKCETTAYSAVSDANGNYTITGIPPGDYNFVTKMPDEKGEVGAIDEKLKINAGLNAWGDRPVCCKQDLQLISPAHEATVSSTTPTLSWKAYPYATSYEVSLQCPGYPDTERVITTTQWTVTPPLPNGVTCWWGINASGPNGRLANSHRYSFHVP
jgi:serine/threonine-protein kinase